MSDQNQRQQSEVLVAGGYVTSINVGMPTPPRDRRGASGDRSRDRSGDRSSTSSLDIWRLDRAGSSHSRSYSIDSLSTLGTGASDEEFTSGEWNQGYTKLHCWQGV